MNIDFSADPTFSSYVLLLILAGVVMLVLAAVSNTSPGLRLLDAAVGLGFLGYGIYLLAFFDGTQYVLFFYAFALPVILAIKTFQARRGVRVGVSA